MTYLSYGFAVFLMFGLIAYYTLPSVFQWKILLILSVLFYIFQGKSGFVFVAATVIITWSGGVLLDKKRDNNSVSPALLIICSFANVFMLLLMKSLFHFSKGDILLPLGIAFYTLMAVGYLIDVRREAVMPQKNIAKLALYLLYFPHIVIGPISRYDDVCESLFSEKKWNKDNFFYGVRRIIWGAFKKLVIANRIMPIVEEISGDPGRYKGAYILVLMFLYAIELYADFSGGIDVVLGVSAMFGIRLKENFLRPYFSKSLAEYWRRWHISMSSWFRDYMFYPISTSEPMQKLSRNLRKQNRTLARKVPVYLSLILVWLATGLWHGVALNYVAWGLLNGLLLILFKELEGIRAGKEKQRNKYLAVAFTFFITSSLKLFDCYDGLGAFAAFGTMITKFNYNIIMNGGLLVAGASVYDYVVIAAGCVMIFLSSLAARERSISERIEGLPVFARVFLWGTLIIICVVFGVYGIGYEKADFIYNRF